MFDRVGLKLGNYRLVRLVGQGGFADVYQGEHVYLKTEVAVKVLHDDFPSNLLQNFLLEARNHARLNHPNIVQVLDFGIENKIPFLVMNYAAHGTLRQRHPAGSMLETATIVSYVKQIAAALQYAHTRKIIHRDIKPENMLLSNEDTIMLSDFGIAIALRNFHNANKLTLLSLGTTIAGTTTYMAPEQFSGTPHYASDQYSLATVVYEWFCGTPPFTGPDFQTAVKHMYRQPPLIRDTIPTLAPAIDKVITKALEKNPQQRFPSVQHFADALEAACQPTSSRLYPATKALVSSIYSVNTISISLRDQLISKIGVMHEKTSQFLANHLLLFSKTLSASISPEQRTLMSFRQLPAPSSIQAQTMVLKHPTTPIAVPVPAQQTKNGLFTAGSKKKWLLAIAIFCLSVVIALSFIPFIQTTIRIPEKQTQTTVTPVPNKTNTSVIPVSQQIKTPSPVTKPSSLPTPVQTTLPVVNPTQVVTPEPTPVIPILVVTPSALSTDNCIPYHRHRLYRCIITLTLSSSYNGQLSWQVSSINVHAYFSSKHGTLSAGQSQQIIIDVFHICPASGSFVFSGPAAGVSVPWNC